MASGKKAVLAALAGNSLIGVAKFIAFAFSGSASMLSEGIHSVADVTNQSLILIGIKRSEAEANRKHIYGYDAERFFWTLISAVGIFFLGCGVTVYHGIASLAGDHTSHPGLWDYLILIFALIVEGYTLYIAYRGINEDRGEKPFGRFLRESADPTPIAVLLEDGVACLGIVIAFFGILFSELLSSSIPDGIASIIIGLLLGFVAVFLIIKNHGLIVGLSVTPEVERNVLDYLNSQSSVERILDFKSRVLSAERYRLKMEVEFEGKAIAKRVLDKEDLKELRARIGQDDEALRAFLTDFADRVIDGLGDEVDRLEKEIQERVPQAQHIDIEAD